MGALSDRFADEIWWVYVKHIIGGGNSKSLQRWINFFENFKWGTLLKMKNEAGIKNLINAFYFILNLWKDIVLFESKYTKI